MRVCGAWVEGESAERVERIEREGEKEEGHGVGGHK